MTNQENPVTLVYTNYRGETSERTITPIKPWFGSTEWHPEPQWLLTAFDHEKQASRDFALKDFGYPAPSPRAQALEELLSDDMLKDISTEFISWKGENPYKVHRGGYAAWEVEKPAIKAALSFAIRALSSQPVADTRPTGGSNHGE